MDTHFHDTAGSMSLSLCPTKVANSPLMIARSDSQYWLQRLQNKNHWPSINSYFDVLSCETLLKVIIVSIIILAYSQPFRVISQGTQGNAMPSNILEWVALIYWNLYILLNWALCLIYNCLWTNIYMRLLIISHNISLIDILGPTI